MGTTSTYFPDRSTLNGNRFHGPLLRRRTNWRPTAATGTAMPGLGAGPQPSDTFGYSGSRM